MSGAELVVLIVALCATMVLWYPWFLTAATVQRTLGKEATLRGVVLGPFLALGALFVVLRAWASHDVRDSPAWLGYYLVFGAGWVPLMLRFSVLLGFHPREDVIERRNPAARIAWAGALAAYTFAFSGANVGDGPGVGVVLFAAGLASGGVFATWTLYEIVVGVAERVTVERSRAAAVGLAGLLVGAGIVCGRAAAGDWVDASSTISDFGACAWPLPLAVMALGLLERLTPARVCVPRVIGGVFLPILALSWVQQLGPW